MSVFVVGDWEINHCSWLPLHISTHAQLPKAVSENSCLKSQPSLHCPLCSNYHAFFLKNSDFVPVRNKCNGQDIVLKV